MNPAQRFMVGGALVLHGLAHALPGMRVVDRLAGWPVGTPAPGASLLVVAATLLWVGAMVGLVGAGLSVWGGPVPGRRCRPFAAVGAGSSLLLLGTFRPEYALLGIVLSVLVLVLVWRGNLPGRVGGTAAEGGGSGWMRRSAGLLAAFFLVYLAAAIVARPWHMRWGSTDTELDMPLPGDELADEPLRYGILFDLVLAPAGLLFFEIPHFIMERRMLLGIKELAEGTARVPLAHMDRDGFLRRLDRRVPEWMERQGVPGAAILLLQDGMPIWSKSYGWADRDARRPLEIGSVMMTHSISKSVTAWGVMRLVEEGRVGLDDPVRRYLTDWMPAGEGHLADRVTVRHLLSHSSGLPLGPVGVHYEPGQEIPPLAETLTAPSYSLVREPGAGFEYSNLGYGVLEWLVEEVTGRDFGEFMRTEVLLPLRMHDSTFDWDEALHGHLPLGYGLRGAAVPPYTYPFRASGGLLSTLEDLGRFAAAGMGGRGEEAGDPVLAPASVEEMYRSQIRISGLFTVVAGDYGLGHFLETLPGDRRAVWHGGQGLGWMTHFHSVPETGDGIVILTNSQRSWPLFALILRDWAEWRGLAPVGMGRIATAQEAMKGVVGLILLAALGWAFRLGRGLQAGRRRPGGFARTGEWSRAVELVAGGALAAGLLWAVRQDYLYISSIFPTTSVWLGWSLAALAAALLASGCFPTIKAAAQVRGDAR